MGEELEQLRASLEATRSVVKGAIRALRSASQFLADLDERIVAVERTAEEAQRDGRHEYAGSAAGE